MASVASKVASTTTAAAAASSTVPAKLDKAVFTRVVPKLGVRVPAKQCHAILKQLKTCIFRGRHMRTVLPDPTDSQLRLVLLENESLESLEPSIRAVIDNIGLGVVTHNVEQGYDNMTADEVLRQLLPDNVEEVQTGFETMGHVAHMNLRDDMLPYKLLIGEVVLDKNNKIRTVVNKTGMISTQFRTFPLEVLAGDDELDVEVKEHGIFFSLNVADVYWNSKLQEEHRRLVETFKKGCIIADATCGVGPFALPAAKHKQCTVYANDLNPKSFHWLQKNVQRNKVTNLVHTYNQDARVFLRELLGNADPRPPSVSHIVTNLPATGLEFLDCLNGLFSPSVWTAKEDSSVAAAAASTSEGLVKQELPMVHCYCFSNSTADWTADVLARAAEALGANLDPDVDFATVREVRDVAPNKSMYCLEFRLPERIAFGIENTRNEASIKPNVEDPPQAKRAKTDDEE